MTLEKRNPEEQNIEREKPSKVNVDDFAKIQRQGRNDIKDKEFADTTKEGFKGLPSRPFDTQVRYLKEVIGFKNDEKCKEIATALNEGKVNLENLYDVYNPKTGYSMKEKGEINPEKHEYFPNIGDVKTHGTSRDGHGPT